MYSTNTRGNRNDHTKARVAKQSRISFKVSIDRTDKVNKLVIHSAERVTATESCVPVSESLGRRDRQEMSYYLSRATLDDDDDDVAFCDVTMSITMEVIFDIMNYAAEQRPDVTNWTRAS
jgi:hypothetical protein